MDNLEMSKVFREIWLLLEIDDVAFKPASYFKVSRMLELMPDDICLIYHNWWEKALISLPWIWESIAKKAIELIETGKLKYLEKLKKENPIQIMDLVKIEWIWPKTVKKLHDAFWIKSLKDLEIVARKWKIHTIPWFKEKSEEKILKSIEFFKSQHWPVSYKYAKTVADNLIKKIKSFPETQKIEIAGSLRRKKEFIWDIDILVQTKDPEKLIEKISKIDDIIYIHWKWLTKISIKLKNGIDTDIKVVSKNSWWSALQYFTWNKDHNINLRRIAQKKWLKLNEYWLYKWNTIVAGKTEKEIYEYLAFNLIPPEQRINDGEFLKYKISNHELVIASSLLRSSSYVKVK